LRIGLTLIVLVLDVIALVSIFGARGRGRRLVWTLAVLLLPIIGALGWLLRGRQSSRVAEPV